MKRYLLFLLLSLTTSVFLMAQNKTKTKQSYSKENYSAYLFVYFTGNEKNGEAIRFALSKDGHNYNALNNNNPVINSADISSSGGVRDPHILRSMDGKAFYMVSTDMVAANGWNSNRGIVLSKSNDLIHWTSGAIHFPKRFKGQDSLLRVWAPQTIYDPVVKKYMIYFSLKHGVNDPDKIYYAYTNKDFTDLETEPKLLFASPTNGASIDADIVLKGDKYYLFFKTEDKGAGIKIAVSNKLTENYQLQDKYVQQTNDPVEGVGVFQLNNGEGYVLMYDVYTKGRYQFTLTKDFKNFKVIDDKVTMNFHPRHGTVMPVTAAEKKRLEKKW